MFFVFGIEVIGFMFGQLNYFSGDDVQVGFFEVGQDFVDYVFGNGVWFDDGQGVLQCYW